jgi:hypothetical protein
MPNISVMRVFMKLSPKECGEKLTRAPAGGNAAIVGGLVP